MIWASVLKVLASPRGLVGLAGVAVIAMLLVQTARLRHAKSDLAAARRNNVDIATGVTWKEEAAAQAKSASTLEAALDRQAQALQLFRASQEQATKAGAQAVAAAKALSEHDRGAAAAVLGMKAHGDACAAADALIVGALGQGAGR